MIDALQTVFLKNNLVVAFAAIGLIVWLSYFISAKFTRGRIHGSAIAIITGLVLAYIGGIVTRGKKGLADLELLITSPCSEVPARDSVVFWLCLCYFYHSFLVNLEVLCERLSEEV